MAGYKSSVLGNDCLELFHFTDAGFLTKHSQMIVRPANSTEIMNIVRIHKAAFKGFFLSDLGNNFLEKYYSYVLRYRYGILLAAISEKMIVGFVAGFANPSGFYNELQRNKMALAISVLPAIIRKPKRIQRILANFKRTKSFSEDPELKNDIAELSSICVGTGEKRGIGTELVNAFILRAQELGANSVRLTTDTYKNEAANAFYLRRGFHLLKTFEAQPGRWLNKYEKSI